MIQTTNFKFMSDITYIDEVDIKNKTVLLRADFDVSLNRNNTISDDMRIKQNIPTLKYLLKNNNKIICIAKLNRPKQRSPEHSLKIVVEYLPKYLPNNKITLVNDFLTEKNAFINQKPDEVLVLENIRFYPEEKQNDPEFAKKLASLADVYVNDCFAVSHRVEASVVGVPQLLPSYGGLLLKREIDMISKAIKNPQKPIVAIMGGAKISTKINLIGKLIEIADYLLIGGGLANTFFCGKNIEIGKSYCELAEVESAKKILELSKNKKTELVLPLDVVVGNPEDKQMAGKVVSLNDISKTDMIMDIGPETKAKFGTIIAHAKTIIWNGPLGYIENPIYQRGTDFIYYSITHNEKAISIVGGGDTLFAISHKEYIDKITHVSTGGGAMLEFIEKGTLPGIEALKNKPPLKSYSSLTQTLPQHQTEGL